MKAAAPMLVKPFAYGAMSPARTEIGKFMLRDPVTGEIIPLWRWSDDVVTAVVLAAVTLERRRATTIPN